MASLSLAFGQASHVGLRRADNQDALGIFPGAESAAAGERLFVVADGMGGHLGGREASRLAVETLESTFFAGPDADPVTRLTRAFEAANLRIHACARHEPTLFGMGTTCTALALLEERALIAHIGDSRAYRITRDGIRQLTDDHTRVGDLVRRQLITEEEAARHPNRNILNRAMGVQAEVEVDVIETEPLQPDEAFVLCTDGLASVSPGEIRDIVLSHPPQQACDRLVELANERGGHDNVTVVVIRAADTASDGQPPGSGLRRGWGGLFLLLLLLALAAFLVA